MVKRFSRRVFFVGGKENMEKKVKCHILNQRYLSRCKFNKFKENFEHVENISDYSHSSLDVLRCKTCGSLYLDYFQEVVGFLGNDECWNHYVPVSTADIVTVKKGGFGARTVAHHGEILCGPSGRLTLIGAVSDAELNTELSKRSVSPKHCK